MTLGKEASVKPDRTTKALLFAIALGLWVNVASNWLRPAELSAQNTARIQSDVADIAADVNSIASGLCLNSNIC